MATTSDSHDNGDGNDNGDGDGNGNGDGDGNGDGNGNGNDNGNGDGELREVSEMEKSKRGQKNATGALSNKNRQKTTTKGDPFNNSPPKSRASEQTLFRMFYERGDLPAALENDVRGGKIRWKSEPQSLDYHHFLPLFFDGLRETNEPYATLAEHGVTQLIQVTPHKTSGCIPQLVIPIKKALETRHPDVACRTLRSVQLMLRNSPEVGPALVPYYRQILPPMNALKTKSGARCRGDGIDYGQWKGRDVGELVDETLTMLEQFGGENAFINIKYMIPTYEGSVS